MNKNASSISTLFKDSKTICIGRFVMEVPAEAEVVYGPAYMNADIEIVKNGASAMEKIMAEDSAIVAKEVVFAKELARRSDSMVGKMVDGPAPGQKILFGLSGSSFYQIRSYTKLGEHLLISWISSFPEPEKYQRWITHLSEISKRARFRQEMEIPTEQGLCIDGVLIEPLDEFVTERVTLGVRLKSHPDVHFSLDLTAKDAVVPSDALEWRVEGAAEEATKLGGGDWYSRIKFLRKGNRSLGNWHGFEVLASKPKQKTEGASHEFAFVSLGEAANPTLPVIDVALHSGVLENQPGSVKPSVTDDEAVAIWDRLIGSIRVRSSEGRVGKSGK